jgi:hypothetical protein
VRAIDRVFDPSLFGLAILIDEAQDLDQTERVAVCSSAHEIGQQGWPALFALAGLPSLPRVLAEAKSYAERLFLFERIEHLESDLARAALAEPAAEEGVVWAEDALSLLVDETSGYPYFLQQFGQETWNCAGGAAITLTDARVGAAQGRAALDSGFFRVRWDRATRAEQRYLRAMADLGPNGGSTGEIAGRLGKSANSFGPARANLIAKGLIYAPEHGVVAFTVPGMAEFIRRQAVTD